MRTLLLLLASVAACTSPSASPRGLQPQIALNSFNGQLRVNIGLQTTTPIDVSATFRGMTVVATTSTQGLDNVHGTYALLLFDLDHAIAGEEPVTIDIDGVETEIDAPPPLDDVQVPAMISRTQPTTIHWTTTSADPMSWSVEASTCTAGAGSIAPNASSLTLEPADWAPVGGEPSHGTCDTTVRLSRERDLPVSHVFDDASGNEGGSVRWDVVYDATFTSVP